MWGEPSSLVAFVRLAAQAVSAVLWDHVLVGAEEDEEMQGAHGDLGLRGRGGHPGMQHIILCLAYCSVV